MGKTPLSLAESKIEAHQELIDVALACYGTKPYLVSLAVEKSTNRRVIVERDGI